MRYFFRLFLLPLWFASAHPVFADPIEKDKIPKPLEPWVDWVSHGQETLSCPFLYNANQHRCAWPDNLTLDIGANSARFSQRWTVSQKSWVALPGYDTQWPVSVTVDGNEAPVIPRDGRPFVRLEKGQHLVAGNILWQRIPEYLQIPRDTALVSLTRLQQEVKFPTITSDGKVWLNPGAVSEKMEDRFDFEVFRQIDDSVPNEVSVRLVLNVAGRARELKLGKPFSPGFIPLRLDSPLPARIEADGYFRLQVRPGRWTVDIVARYPTPLRELEFTHPNGEWVSEEIWVFKARPHVRIVEVSGGTPIDPSQTNLSDDLKSLPTYRLLPGEKLIFNETRRGDPNPSPDRLKLERDLWLSFDGDVFSLRDHITGQKHAHWRMEMQKPFELGRANANGEDQLITRLTGSERAGIELRHGSLDLSADSRIQRTSSTIPVLGWMDDFDQVDTTLHLPPGWRLIHASGADNVNTSWISRWTLLDLFIVLVVSTAFGRLWGPKIAVLAFITLALTYHEQDAPQWLWLGAVICFGILRVARADGRLYRATLFSRNVILVGLIIVLIPFFVAQIRQGIYPQLEYPNHSVQHFSFAEKQKMQAPEPASESATTADLEEEDVEEELDLAERKRETILPQKLKSEEGVLFDYESYSSQDRSSSGLLKYTPGALLQTGPGLPNWSWNSVRLHWSGPVKPDQSMWLLFVNPTMNLVLSVTRVILLVALLLVMLNIRFQRGSGWTVPNYRSLLRTCVLITASVLLLQPNANVRAEMPDEKLLNELSKKIFEPAECLPNCGSIETIAVNVSENVLTLELKIHSTNDVAIPLPGHTSQWTPKSILRDGRTATGLFRGDDGYLWVHVTKGTTRVQLSGPLPSRDVVQLAFPLRPYRGAKKLSGWDATGFNDDGTVDQQIVLTRSAQQKTEKALLETSNMPPFAQVTRRLIFGVNWQATTTVTRVSPKQGAIVMDLPLLPGESVITEGIRVADGKAKINLPANANSIQWESSLEASATLTSENGTRTIILQAAKTETWIERWEVEVAPLWHLETDGIAAIYHEAGNDWHPQWWPWPGENVTLKLSRPVAATGQTLTIDSSRLAVRPGLRSTSYDLAISLRSSQGGRHPIQLPAGAAIQEVLVNNQAQPLRLEGQTLNLPVSPGAQNYQIRWTNDEGISWWYKTPAINLNIENVNAEVTISHGFDRWTLLTAGPRLGPAVLIWGILIVLLPLSFALSKIPNQPLRTKHWFILGIGLIPAGVWAAFIVVTWFLALSARQHIPEEVSKLRFNLIQTALVLLTVAAASSLIYAISNGLLGSPDMQIAGNQSSAGALSWYQDRVESMFPQPSILSIPMVVYRLLMLLWALWSAIHILRWARWAWTNFSLHGYWREINFARTKKSVKES